MGNNFIFIFLAPLLILSFFEIFFFKPSFFYWALAMVNLTIVISLKKIGGRKIFSWEFWKSFILPFIFINSLAAYSLILSTKAIAHILFSADAIFIFYYLKNIGRENNERFLENISSYGGFLTVFFSLSFLYGLKSFLGIPVLFLITASIIVILLAVYEVLWANRIPLKFGGVYLFLVSLLLIQLTWVLYFLPLSYNFLGLIMAICYYIIIGIIKPFLRGALTKKTVKLYLICGLAGITAVLLSAKWL